MLFASTLHKLRRNSFRLLALAQLFFIVMLLASVFAVSCATSAASVHQDAPQCKAPTLNDLAALPYSPLFEADIPRISALAFLFIVLFPFAPPAGPLLQRKASAFYRQRERFLLWLWGRCTPFHSIGAFFPPFFSRSDAAL